MKKIERVLGVTGIRSEYDILYPVMRELKSISGIKPGLVVVGSHLSAFHNKTIEFIKSDGIEIVEAVDTLFCGDELLSRCRSLGVQLLCLSQTLERTKPDLLLVVGDREEAMAAALLSSYSHIPLAHISGGDVAVGNVDDHIRHAISKLACLHFVTNQDSYSRLIAHGEDKERVHIVGNPGLDKLLNEPLIDRESLFKALQIPLVNCDQEYVVLLHHSVSSDPERGKVELSEILAAIKSLELTVFSISPNTDSGSIGIETVIKEFSQSYKNIYSFPTLHRSLFVNMLRYASLLIGNSSLGFLEAPFLELAAINVGARQSGRFNAGNVIRCRADMNEIKRAIEIVFHDSSFRTSLAQAKYKYGDGSAPRKIAEIISSTELSDDLIFKNFS